jgi:hypothetical protein
MKLTKSGYGMLSQSKRALVLAVIGIMICPIAAMANPTPYVLDTFDSPNVPSSRVVQGKRETTAVVYEANLPVRAGARDTGLRILENPLNSLAAVTVGGGNLSVAQGTRMKAETVIAYGAATRVGGNLQRGGPLLGLNLSNYRNLQFDFSGVEADLNINVVYHTSAPFSPTGYYSTSKINIAPSSKDAPLTLKLPMNNDPNFNWQSVDGITVLINRSGGAGSISYTLDTLTFVP